MPIAVRSAEGMNEPVGREANRRRALAAMAEAVGERGYSETTVRDVLERARMSRRTFYELFDNREHCFLAAYDHARSEALAWLDRVGGPDSSCSPELTRALADLLEYLAARPDFARLLVVEPVAAGRPGLDRHERTMRELAERLARSQRRDSTSLRPEELWIRCEASVGAVHRVVAARIVQGRARDLPGLAMELGGMVRTLAAVG
jgi:AcrR family transcriptional regulator